MTPEAYERHKRDAADRMAEKSRVGREIGPLPEIADPHRRRRAEKTLKAWVETYLRDRFPLPWAKYHLELFQEVERVIRDGGRQAFGAPRGGGKSGLLEAGVLWGVLTGQHPYAVLVTAIGRLAGKAMSSFKTALQNNSLLLADYPEVSFPLIKVGNTPQRCNGMTLDGGHLWLPGGEQAWGKLRIVLPTVPGSPCSGAVIESAGLLEATRGLKYARGDELIRPSVALVDDPQTPRSARSALQCEERKAALNGGICHLGGPSREIGVLAAVTVIESGDMADEILDRTKHPEWHGTRKKLLESWPLGCDPRNIKARSESEGAVETAKLWDAYRELYLDDLANGDTDSKKSTSHYRKHRRMMDRGAVASWTHRKPGCLSAVEYGMRLFFKDPAAMLAEMQNDPGLPSSGPERSLSALEISEKTSGLARYEVPLTATRGTFFIDCHEKLLFYAVAFWSPGFTGAVVDYGSWPKQPGNYFEMAHARNTIAKSQKIKASTDEGRLFEALDILVGELAAREWRTAEGTEVDLELGLIDAGWRTDAVYDFCHQARRKHGVTVRPSHGQSFPPTKCPISRWDPKKTKGVIGDDWHFPPRARGRNIRHVLFDANRRKTFLMRRLATPAADPGSLSLFHAPAGSHRLIGDHVTAEVGKQVETPWGDLTIYSLLPGRDNHLLDCLSGICTAESMLGGKIQRTLAAPEGVAFDRPTSTPAPVQAEPSPSGSGEFRRAKRVPRRRVSYIKH